LFDDLLVLDLSQVFAGPLASRLLAELGATVIKVERPGGEVSRQLPWRVNGRSGYFVQQNRGKLGVGIDLKTEGGRDLLWSLVEQADVLIDGFAPGTLEKYGFSYPSMSARNQRIIVCELSALGRDGPLGRARGYDQIGACYSGVAYTTSSGDAPPIMPSVAMGDAMMALCAYGGIVTALYERIQSGSGQRVDVSLVDGYIQAHSNNLEGYSLSGGQLESRPVGGQNATVCPSGVFHTPDNRWMYIVALSNQEWIRLCKCMGDPRLADDPTLKTNEGRVANRSRVISLLQNWIDQCGSRSAALDILMKGGIAAAPVLSIGEVIDEPQLRFRGSVRMIHDDALGDFAVPGPPFRLSRTKRSSLTAAPSLGEHNREVFERYGGLALEEIDRLHREGGMFCA
jgi:crotonobetainyl-CoA:carnitine CoA-transferase CaiB-like acyl-CoA transferase